MNPKAEKAKALKGIVDRLRGAVKSLREDRPRRRPARKRSSKPAAKACCGGVGTELTKLTDELGIKPKAACKCKQLAKQLDRKGVAWCRENIDGIVDQMGKHYEAYTWREKLTAGLFAVPLLLQGKLNVARPLRSLVDLAIERADAAACACRPSS